MSKYKLKQKIISIILAVLMIVGYAPVSAQTGSNESITETQNTEAEAVSITQDGQPVSAIDLPVDEKTVFKTDFMDAEAYQWQILLPDKNVWVNIVDKTADTCEVSYALVGALLDSESKVSLRCVVTADGQENCSDIVTVKITESTALEPENGAGNRSSQKLGVSSYSMETVGNYMVSPLAEGDDLTTHTVTIKYLYFNEGPNTTGSVSNDYVATLATGTGYSATVSSPIRTGYKPYIAEIGDWKGSHWFTMKANGDIDDAGLTLGTTFNINITNIQEDIIYYVVYLPQDTTYNVSSYLQNIYDDFYTFGGIQTYAAKVGSSVLLTSDTNREGFTTLKYDDAKVAADGSTILDVYYDREYHLMNFHLDGGYGVEPVYARYQTGFKVSKPERAGYTFAGWDVTGVTYNGEDASEKTINATGQTYQAVAEEIATRLAAGETVEIPPFDINFKAKWNPNNAEYNVVYWKENANDNDYSYWGTVTKSAQAGTVVKFNPENDEFNVAKLSFSHNLVQDAVNANGNFSAIQTRYEDEYFTYNADKSSPTASATVKGDGSTVLHVYYSRNKYNLKFYYARTNGVVSESTVTEYDRVTEIEDGQSYVVEMNRAVVNGAPSSILSTDTTQDGSGLKLLGNMGDGNITKLNFTVVNANDKTYKIKSDDGRYLTVTNNGASFSQQETILRVYNYNGYWAIGHETENVWLNHYGGGINTTAKGWTEENTNPSTYLNLYKPDAASHEVTSIESSSNWKIATSTTNASIEGARWSDTGIKTMPVIEDSRYVINREQIGEYYYYYLELKDVKYNQQIADLWPSGAVPSIGVNTLINWGPVDGCAYRTKYGDNASIHIYPTVSAEIINNPKNSESSKFVGWWDDGAVNYQNFHIYYSPVLEGENKVVEYDGKNYAQQEDIRYIMRYNGWTQIKEISLYGVKFYDSVISAEQPGTATEETMNSTFYYNRNPHKLKFYNIATPIKEDDLVYGQSISRFNTLNSDTMEKQYYPENYEPGAYSFKGWSLSPDTYIKVDWENYKMDDADLSVYAFWEKVKHTVTFYETYNDLVNDKAIANGKEYGGIPYNNPQTVSHGEPVNYASTISRDGYNFVGWFYIDEVTGEPVAFLPNNMPVNKDLKIYAEWQDAETMVKYTIHYMLIKATRDENGEYLFADGYKYNLDYSIQTQIADDTTGQIQNGRTKTFSAKALPELWTEDNPNNTEHVDYCHNHYPMLSSHAIMFSPEQQNDSAIKVIDKGTDENGKQIYEIDYTFYYVRLDEVKYTIKYINNDTKTNIFKDFSNTTASATITVDSDTKTTNEAVTTESMKMIQGYVPDAYQKRIVLTAFPKEGTDDNTITFNYREDSNPMYFVEHLIENADGTWTQMAREFSTGTASEQIVRTANNYPGHTFNANQGWVNTSGEYILPGDGENWIGKKSTTTVGETTTNIFIGGNKYTGNPASASGALEAGKILVIRFYYTLNEYDYRIEHRILGNPNNNNWLFGTESKSIETGKAKYGSIVTADASDNNPKKQWKSLAYQIGYWVEGNQSDESRLKKTMQIKEGNNVITFWYVDAPVEIEYKVLVDGITGINVNGCYVTPSLDSTSSHGNSDVHGSAPTAGPGYRFVGWYKDEGGTEAVDSSWVGGDNRLTPKAETNNVIRSATYYAKFEPIKLTINITGDKVKQEDTFLFRIKGKANTATAGIDITVSITGQDSTTVSYIPAGEYTITELNNWSWRYSPVNAQDYTVSVDGDNKVVFNNTPVTNKFWLGGESSKENKFSASVSSGN